MLLIKADLHREGLNFPTFSYKHYIETEGLARLAKDMGYRCWGLPRLEIFHPQIFHVEQIIGGALAGSPIRDKISLESPAVTLFSGGAI